MVELASIGWSGTVSREGRMQSSSEALSRGFHALFWINDDAEIVPPFGSD